MRRPGNICSLVLVVLLLSAVFACKSGEGVAEEIREDVPSEAADGRGFDPLELPSDREIIPRTRPISGAVIGRTEIVDAAGPETQPDSGAPQAVVYLDAIDSVNSQAYRVQIATSKLYGESRKAAAVAEEIFDRPVFVDYEVPYYKVRVGNFNLRDRAEEYQQKARAAGYSNAWVVMVTVNPKEASRLYQDILGPAGSSDSIMVDSIINEYEENQPDND
ncbi:MAG: SPOR domain-containing protein [Candidatus Zixiibacteriota bacterium]|nr:MAG: SPOR domain-containing protein [candidate division Zixibacteria bacterium]